MIIRPAAARSRSRRRLGSQVRAGWSCQASSCVQVSSSAASWTSSSQIWFLVYACSGRLVIPVSLSPRMRSSARARRRWRSSRSASRAPVVLVANRVMRQPWWSVMRNWAPGWGRSRRAMIRMPGGQPVKVAGSHRVSSATWAPARAARRCRGPPARPGWGQRVQRVLHGLAAVDTDRVLQAQVVHVPDNPCTPEPLSPRTSTFERTCSGSWASAASRTAIWSAASLAVALPGRSIAANGSPVPPAPWSTNAKIG